MKHVIAGNEHIHPALEQSHTHISTKAIYLPVTGIHVIARSIVIKYHRRANIFGKTCRLLHIHAKHRFMKTRISSFKWRLRPTLSVFSCQGKAIKTPPPIPTDLCGKFFLFREVMVSQHRRLRRGIINIIHLDNRVLGKIVI